MAMKNYENFDHDQKQNVCSEEDSGLRAVVTVERSYDANISLSPRIDSKAEITERGVQHFDPYQETFSEANKYYLAKQFKHNTDSHFEHQKKDLKGLENLYNKIEHLNEDECKSLVFANNMYWGNTSDNMELDKGAFKSILISIFKFQPYPIQYFHQLVQFRASNQLSDTSIEWIRNDLRCALFVAYLIQCTIENRVLVGDVELVAYIVDYLKYETSNFNVADLNAPSYKSIFPITSTGLAWRIEAKKSLYYNNRIKKEMSWFSNEDDKQIEWAYNYLSSDKRDYLILQSIFIPSSLEDKYSLVLTSLDVLSNKDYTYEIFTKSIDTNDPNFDFESIPLISYRAKVIENMKDAWNKFSASNKNEDLSQIKIYKKDQDLLDSIKKAGGTTSASKVVGQLIKNEHDRIFNNK